MSRFNYSILIAGILLPLVAIPSAGYCAELPAVQQLPSVQQSIHQQERQRALEERLSPSAPDVRLSEPTASLGRLVFPV
ncbi:hemolysin transporter, partial [Yersinia massiliensis]